MNKTIGSIVCGLVLMTSQPVCVEAADFSKKVPTGASFGQVLNIWGEPLEKVEKAVKREVVWYYPDGALVVFKDGRVKRSQPTKAIIALQAQVEAARAISETPVSAQLSGETRDLVRDIAKEVPSGPDSPGGDSAPPPANLGLPQLIPNQAPPGGRVPPPAVAPGELVLEDDEED